MLSLCCPSGDGKQAESKRMIEMSGAGSGSDADSNDGSASQSFADRATGWLKKATAPLQALKDQHEKDQAHVQACDVLKAGAAMQLLPDGRGEVPKQVRVALSSDGAMVTWSGAGTSGVMALSACREVKAVVQTGWIRAGGPVPGQWMLVADDQTVRFEAANDDEKEHWISTLDRCCQEQLSAKSGRKMAAQAKRRMGLEERKREAERRKAEVMKTCGAGGMCAPDPPPTCTPASQLLDATCSPARPSSSPCQAGNTRQRR
jgi:hypothetical protein